MLPKITVVKLKRKDAFEQQRYKVLIGNDEITNVSAVSASLTAEDRPITTVSIQLKTNDFQWTEEDALEKKESDQPETKELLQETLQQLHYITFYLQAIVKYFFSPTAYEKLLKFLKEVESGHSHLVCNDKPEKRQTDIYL